MSNKEPTIEIEDEKLPVEINRKIENIYEHLKIIDDLYNKTHSIKNTILENKVYVRR
ncbi:hypothetical protein A3Q56_05699 [Intoshia linei]|uniref:Uncharacterized protein n=1 Tax=Intoshia linei TaxID=1819745 RepID=A0A177AX62_9BILA|nr:hypothetical protein A3Q56_05699 [Intoshia linei]